MRKKESGREMWTRAVQYRKKKDGEQWEARKRKLKINMLKKERCCE